MLAGRCMLAGIPVGTSTAGRCTRAAAAAAPSCTSGPPLPGCVGRADRAG